MLNTLDYFLFLLLLFEPKFYIRFISSESYADNSKYT